MFPKYQQPFWYFYALIVAAMLGCIWTAYYIIEVYINEPDLWILIPLIIVVALVYIAGLDYIKTRYWVIEEASLEEETPPSEKLSTAGLVIFLVFAVAAIGIFIFFDRVIDPGNISPSMYTIGSVLYLFAVLGGAVFILKKFTGQNDQPDN